MNDDDEEDRCSICRCVDAWCSVVISFLFFLNQKRNLGELEPVVSK